MKTISSPDEKNHRVRQNVRDHYGQVAEQSGCGCGPACCSAEAPAPPFDANTAAQRLGYSASDLTAVPEGSNLGLGCGNPHAIASLKPGQTVLDLGSGAGFDVFLAAAAVGPKGHVIGVDMTPEMLARAREHADRGGYGNVEFRLGEIEHLPVADASVDVILSNCVINLSPDKARVFSEAFRVLRPGGRLAISDVVALQPVPVEIRNDVQLHAACAAGAAEISDLRALLEQSGFTEIRITPKPESRTVIAEWFPGRGLEDLFTSATLEALKPAGT